MKKFFLNIARVILFLLLNREDYFYRLEELEEVYDLKRKQLGEKSAAWWYLRETLKSVPHLTINNISWGGFMFKNYFKIAWRNIKKDKLYSSISIVGFSIGITLSALVMFYVLHEKSFDTFHEKADRVFRINASSNEFTTERVGPGVAPAIKQKYPEIEFTVRYSLIYKVIVQYNDKTFNEDNIVATESSYFDVFSFPLTNGNATSVLDNPNSLVITESMAKKYFGNTDPIGKLMEINLDKSTFLCKVNGVMQDYQQNTDLKFDMLISLSTFDWLNSNLLTNHIANTFFVLNNSAQAEALTTKLVDFVKEYIDQDSEVPEYKYSLQHLSDIHLNQSGFSENNDIYIYTIISFVILIIAGINFVNLSSAKSITRAREVGVRKTLGAIKKQIISQFICESIILSIIAAFISAFFVYLLLPVFNDITNLDIGIARIDLSFFIVYMFLLVIMIGLLCGLYPAIIISKLKPITNLQNQLSNSLSIGLFRKVFLISQFALSTIFIICSIVIFSQLQYLSVKDLGFDKNNLIVINNASVLEGNTQSFKTQLMKIPSISNVTGTNSLLMYAYDARIQTAVFGKDASISLRLKFCDKDFLDTYQIQMAAGRFLNDELYNDKDAIIINEETARQLDLKNPLDKSLTFNYDKWSGRQFRIVGVVKDFNYLSPKGKIDNYAFLLSKNLSHLTDNYISIRVNSDDIKETLQAIKREWDSFSPKLVFDYSLFKDNYEELFLKEKTTEKISIAFSFFSIFISILGFFGMISYIIENRRKEIAIRKVLGASKSNIIEEYLKHFGMLLLTAIILACPVAYFFMNEWLAEFAYKIDISVGVFITAGMIMLSITFIVIVFKVLRATSLNPVIYLRNE